MQEIAEPHLRRLRHRVRVRVHAQLPADDQPPGRRPSSRASVLADLVGDGPTCSSSSRRVGAEDFSYLLPESPAATSSSPTATAATARAATAWGPCMLHNPSYDFNDDLIPLGAHDGVRLAEAWLASPRD